MKLDQKNVRKYHYYLLFNLIVKHKQLTRTQLAKMTNMSNTSVGKIVSSLLSDNLIVEKRSQKKEIGRKSTLLKINTEEVYIIGVHIDIDTIKVASVSLDGRVKNKRVLHNDFKDSIKKILKNIVDNIFGLISHLKSSAEILGVGISLPGIVSWPDGEILSSPQLHWKNIDIKNFFQEKLNYYVYVDNHVKATLMFENISGLVSSYKNVVCIYVGSGVGSSVMVDGNILRGHFNALGEIGHMTLDPNGAMCDCGRLGCLQTFLSSTEIEKQTNKSILEVLNSFENGDQWAESILKRAKNYLALSISNAVCLYNPQVILLTGPMLEKFPFLVEDLYNITNQQVWHPLKKSYKIISKEYEPDNDISIASAIVLKEFFEFSI